MQARLVLLIMIICTSASPQIFNNNKAQTGIFGKTNAGIFGNSNNSHVSGNFSLSFYPTSELYVTISADGSFDYEIEKSEGFSSFYNPDGTVSSVGNTSIFYNPDGKVSSIGNISIFYNPDGTVSSVGKIRIFYNPDGTVSSVGNISIFYNPDGKVSSVGNASIFYNPDGTVSSISGNVGSGYKLKVR